MRWILGGLTVLNSAEGLVLEQMTSFVVGVYLTTYGLGPRVWIVIKPVGNYPNPKTPKRAQGPCRACDQHRSCRKTFLNEVSTSTVPKISQNYVYN